MDIESINFHLESFDGPLDLLLHLINKNKVSIYDIPISFILDQYMEYIDTWQKLDMDIAGEFITMASELMLIKSKMMLPKAVTDDEEDPRERLAAALIEYKSAKETAALLGERYKVYHGRLVKEPEDIDPDVELKEHSINQLVTAFERIMRRSRVDSDSRNTENPPERTLVNLLSHKIYSIPGKIIGIMKLLYINGDTSFEDIMLRCENKSELITAFIAILELMRAQRVIIVSDSENTDDIVIRLDRSFHNRAALSDMTDY